MGRPSAKWWLAVAALLLLTPALSATRQHEKEKGCGARDDRDKKCRQVPEGGSTAAYLLGAGVTCIGAMVLRSRLGKPQTP